MFQWNGPPRKVGIPGWLMLQPFRPPTLTDFLMGFVDNEPAACISVVRYGGDFGFLGFYICRPELRGQGYGLQIWQADMGYLEGQIVGLDGVVDQQDNYRKSGFVLAHNNIRYGGDISIAATDSPKIRPIEAADIEKLLESDAPFYPGDQRAFMTFWLGVSKTRSGMVCVQDGEIEGFGVARTCRMGMKVGPLFANTEAIADDLFRHLAAHCEAGPIYLDVPETNPAAIALAERHGLAPVFETARMYKG